MQRTLKYSSQIRSGEVGIQMRAPTKFQRKLNFDFTFKHCILNNIYITLTLVAACLHLSAKKCSSIWSHTQHYTHSFKLFNYIMCGNREVISCSQFGRSQVLNMLQSSRFPHRDWHFSCSLSVKCLLCFLTHSPTSTNVGTDILPKS